MPPRSQLLFSRKITQVSFPYEEKNTMNSLSTFFPPPENTIPPTFLKTVSQVFYSNLKKRHSQFSRFQKNTKSYFPEFFLISPTAPYCDFLCNTNHCVHLMHRRRGKKTKLITTITKEPYERRQKSPKYFENVVVCFFFLFIHDA